MYLLCCAFGSTKEPYLIPEQGQLCYWCTLHQISGSGYKAISEVPETDRLYNYSDYMGLPNLIPRANLIPAVLSDFQRETTRGVRRKADLDPLSMMSILSNVSNCEINSSKLNLLKLFVRATF